jgi:hypothetical protein
MRNRHAIIAAAALAVGTVGLAPRVLAQQSQQPGNQPGGSMGAGGSGAGQSTGSAARTGDRPGGVAAQAGAGAQDAHTSEVRFIIARVTDAALSEGGSAQLLAYLADEDRQRLSENQDRKNPQLQQNIEKLKQVWQQKYNRPFEIGTRRLAFDDTRLRVMEGDMSDAARTAGERVGAAGAATGTGAAGTGATGGGADASGGTSGTGAAGGGGTAGGGATGTGAGGASGTGASGTAAGTGASGRGDVSTSGERISVIIPQEAQAPTVVLHLTREDATATSWKLDLPDTVDAQQLQANLQRHVATVSDQPDQLPASEDEAYVLVAQHVLAAMTDASAAVERGNTDRPAGAGAGPDMNRPGEQGGGQRQPPQDQAPRAPGDTGGAGSGTGGSPR